MVLEDIPKEGTPEVIIYGPCETLTCKYCGKEYPSRGKNDPGYCRVCEANMIQHTYSGGPLDGEVAP